MNCFVIVNKAAKHIANQNEKQQREEQIKNKQNTSLSEMEGSQRLLRTPINKLHFQEQHSEKQKQLNFNDYFQPQQENKEQQQQQQLQQKDQSPSFLQSYDKSATNELTNQFPQRRYPVNQNFLLQKERLTYSTSQSKLLDQLEQLKRETQAATNQAKMAWSDLYNLQKQVRQRTVIDKYSSQLISSGLQSRQHQEFTGNQFFKPPEFLQTANRIIENQLNISEQIQELKGTSKFLEKEVSRSNVNSKQQKNNNQQNQETEQKKENLQNMEIQNNYQKLENETIMEINKSKESEEDAQDVKEKKEEEELKQINNDQLNNQNDDNKINDNQEVNKQNEGKQEDQKQDSELLEEKQQQEKDQNIITSKKQNKVDQQIVTESILVNIEKELNNIEWQTNYDNIDYYDLLQTTNMQNDKLVQALDNIQTLFPEQTSNSSYNIFEKQQKIKEKMNMEMSQQKGGSYLDSLIKQINF